MDNTRPSRQQLEQEIAELRRHIETHEQLFLHAVDPIYRFNLITSEYDYWSPSCINTHGYTPEEMISGGIEKEASCIHPDDSILLQKHIDELLSESVGQDFQQIIEYRFKHKTRGYRWLSDSRALLRDTDGSPLAIIGEVRDITARKQTEEKLQETQNFLQAAVAQSPTGIIIADAPDATIRLANQAAFGFDARKGDSRLLTNADIAQYAENWQTLHADGSPYPREELPLSRAVKDGVVTRNKEVILRDNEGHDRWASINAAPIRNAEGEIIAGIVIFNNITERKQVEQAMRQSEQRFRTFMEQSTSAIEIYEPDGKMSLVNDAWTKLWNLKKEDMADYNIFGDPQCETTGLTPAFRDALQGNSRIIPDVAYDPNDSSFKKGRKRWIRPRIYPITDRAGTIQNVVLAYDDITEQRHLEEQLRQSQKMEAVGQLAGGIAHDFNNILTSILGNTELLKMDLPSGCEQVEFVDEVIKSATRAAALTKQLLTFARKGKQQVVPVNIHDLATQTGRMLTHSIDRLIDIRMELNASQNTIMGDPTQLHSAMLNLGLNARDAMSDGGTLTYTTRNMAITKSDCDKNLYNLTPGDFLEIRITDTGVGMSEDIQKKIFEPFFTTKEVGKGTGLGLAGVYGCVRNHDGNISVSSKPGQGTTFTILLPLTDTSSEPTDKTAISDEPAKGSGHILIVDDEESVRSFVGASLRSMGYTVATGNDGLEGLEYYREHHQEIDLVILDLIMPKMNGQVAFMEMKKINPDVKVLVSSGFSSTETSRQMLHDGVLDMLNKPFQVATLAETVAKYIRPGN